MTAGRTLQRVETIAMGDSDRQIHAGQLRVYWPAVPHRTSLYIVLRPLDATPGAERRWECWFSYGRYTVSMSEHAIERDELLSECV